MLPILEYLGGIETQSNQSKQFSGKRDFRIPRRDWNMKEDGTTVSCSIDFRIPRRDWNFGQGQNKELQIRQILEYLGGIETQQLVNDLIELWTRF